MKIFRKYTEKEIQEVYGDQRNQRLNYNDNIEYSRMAFVCFVIAIILIIYLLFVGY